MKRIILFIAILLFLLGSFSSCNKEERDLLTKTKWKLVGFVDVETETIKEAYPNGEYHYVLTFNKWGKFSGLTSSNSIEGKYKINYYKHSINFSMKLGTVANEFPDGYIYTDALFKVDYFFIQENELKLYYNNKQNYLLYRQKVS
jgi:hypothetical protein